MTVRNERGANPGPKRVEHFRQTADRFARYVAVHEAGHAVAHWYAGLSFDQVLLRRPSEYAADPYADGRAGGLDVEAMVSAPPRFPLEIYIDLLDANWLAPTEWALRLEEQQYLIEAHVMVHLAGPVAEARYRRCALDAVFATGGADDQVEVLDVLSVLEKLNSPVDTKVQSHITRTRDMFRGGRVWSATLAVADALSKQLVLTFDDVLEIIRDVTGEGVRPPVALARPRGIERGRLVEAADRLGAVRISSVRLAEAAKVSQAATHRWLTGQRSGRQVDRRLRQALGLGESQEGTR